jgi:hypothetical protein
MFFCRILCSAIAELHHIIPACTSLPLPVLFYIEHISVLVLARFCSSAGSFFKGGSCHSSGKMLPGQYAEFLCEGDAFHLPGSIHTTKKKSCAFGWHQAVFGHLLIHASHAGGVVQGSEYFLLHAQEKQRRTTLLLSIILTNQKSYAYV